MENLSLGSGAFPFWWCYSSLLRSRCEEAELAVSIMITTSRHVHNNYAADSNQKSGQSLRYTPAKMLS
jgi:hypothetical protein